MEQLVDYVNCTCSAVLIGEQIWMVENLDVEWYRNGVEIPQVQNKKDWANLTTGAWCYYEGSTKLGKIYGKLYNWYAVNDPQGLAPEGFHIPSDAEWTTLTNHFGGSSGAGGKLKESGTIHWEIPNLGATNRSGFTALPGGCCNYNGAFTNLFNCALWWSSTEFDMDTAWSRCMSNDSNAVYRSYYLCKKWGFSVRCIMDT